MSDTTLYELLGVNRSSSDGEIKKVSVKLCLGVRKFISRTSSCGRTNESPLLFCNAEDVKT